MVITQAAHYLPRLNAQIEAAYRADNEYVPVYEEFGEQYRVVNNEWVYHNNGEPAPFAVIDLLDQENPDARDQTTTHTVTFGSTSYVFTYLPVYDDGANNTTGCGNKCDRCLFNLMAS